MSVLGQLLFAAYVSPVGGVISDHGVKFHQHADDTQLFLSMSINNCTVGRETLASRTTALKLWCLQNDLQLNANKSDVILLGNPPQLRAAADNDINSITVAGRELSVSSEFKSLGVLLDQQLSLQKHTTAVAKACNYHIQAIRHVRPLLTCNVAEMLTCSLVNNRLDYCNSLLYGAPVSSINKLQQVLNNAARQSRQCTDARRLLASLHWLPVQQRITF